MRNIINLKSWISLKNHSTKVYGKTRYCGQEYWNPSFIPPIHYCQHIQNIVNFGNLWNSFWIYNNFAGIRDFKGFYSSNTLYEMRMGYFSVFLPDFQMWHHFQHSNQIVVNLSILLISHFRTRISTYHTPKPQKKTLIQNEFYISNFDIHDWNLWIISLYLSLGSIHHPALWRIYNEFLAKYPRLIFRPSSILLIFKG